MHAAPHVAVLSTGDEVADPATPHLRPGAIRDANRPMLLAAAADAGASTMDLVLRCLDLGLICSSVLRFSGSSKGHAVSSHNISTCELTTCLAAGHRPGLGRGRGPGGGAAGRAGCRR